TYVFKRGVVYRGELRPDEHGSEGAPIILTSDPAWGSGEAAIVGSEHVTGWTKGATNAAIPDAAQVWQADLPFAPRSAWVVDGDKVQRIELARTPNWTVTDPQDVKSGWWRFEQPEWWSGACKIDFAGHRAHLGVDTRNLTRDADYYVGATARVEYGIVMGTPYPIAVEGYDANRKGIVFQGIWTGDSETITTGCRYFLEDKPHYLDSAGEFWFERLPGNGDGGRLFARLPGDADPNKVRVEVARRCNLIEAGDLRHVTVSGLAFRFTNTHWDLGQPPWGHADVNNAAIRVRGAVDGLRIAGCSFAHVAKAVRIDAGSYEPEGRTEQPFGAVTVADNDISETDHGAIEIRAHGEGDVTVLRNRMREIGRRTFRQDHSHALCVGFPATMEIAGNILERCTGAGLFLFGGKGSGDEGDAPMARHLVHHNKVVDSLLSANDWGGIETWQGGPFYLYSNISGNPGGRWWAHDPNKPASARLGFAYYHDGAFKNYDFNCVAYGLTTDWKSTEAAHAAFYEAVPTIHNQIFNCTVSRFWVGSQWSPGGGRHFFLGNVFDEIGGEVFQHGQLKEDKGEKPAHYPHAGTAYGSNVVSRFTGDHFGIYESSGRGYADPKAMAESFADHPALAMDVGTVAAASPLMDPDKRDYRAKSGSAVVDKGVKLFVPWGLARTVGEWQFRRNNADATRLLDDHWYLAPYYVRREDYHACPVYD
nr:right-handed parallel beta-helix repeat-containing protein [Planctomycetota bacterium]